MVILTQRPSARRQINTTDLIDRLMNRSIDQLSDRLSSYHVLVVAGDSADFGCQFQLAFTTADSTPEDESDKSDNDDHNGDTRDDAPVDCPRTATLTQPNHTQV